MKTLSGLFLALIASSILIDVSIANTLGGRLGPKADVSKQAEASQSVEISLARELFEVSGVAQRESRAVSSATNVLETLLASDSASEDARDARLAEASRSVRSRQQERIDDKLEIYAVLFSEQELRGLIDFAQSEAGARVFNPMRPTSPEFMANVYRGWLSAEGERELDEFVASPLGQKLADLADVIKWSRDVSDLEIQLERAAGENLEDDTTQ